MTAWLRKHAWPIAFGAVALINVYEILTSQSDGRLFQQDDITNIVAILAMIYLAAAHYRENRD